MTTTTTTTAGWTRHVTLGRHDGSRYVLEAYVEVRDTAAPHMTIDHVEHVESVREFTFGVNEYRGSTMVAWFRDVEYLPDEIVTDDLRLAFSVFNHWHLNGMRARCVHQDGWHICPGFRCPDSHGGGDRCTNHRVGDVAECGYGMGTAWLSEPLTEAVEPVSAREKAA